MGFFVKRNTYIPTKILTQFIVEEYLKEFSKELLYMTDSDALTLYVHFDRIVDRSLVNLEHFLERSEVLNIDLRGL